MKHPIHDKKLFGTATVGTKGQIVIPANAREELGLSAGDKLYIAGSPSKKVLFCLGEEQLEHLINRLTSDDSEDAQEVKAQFEALKKHKE
ncbi:MAG TPA: AbrB/MazE/SpoVT family DNA-binding domain-containing protein [Candidatus Saccharimonadales bacterium]